MRSTATAFFSSFIRTCYNVVMNAKNSSLLLRWSPIHTTPHIYIGLYFKSEEEPLIFSCLAENDLPQVEVDNEAARVMTAVSEPVFVNSVTALRFSTFGVVNGRHNDLLVNMSEIIDLDNPLEWILTFMFLSGIPPSWNFGIDTRGKTFLSCYKQMKRRMRWPWRCLIMESRQLSPFWSY